MTPKAAPPENARHPNSSIAPNWGITLRKGQHEGLISLTTFDHIQERLKGNAKAPARKDINADFPLRGFVLCNDCGKPLTACWSKGKMGVNTLLYVPGKGLPELPEVDQA